MTSTNPISPKSEFGQWHQIAFFSKAFKTCKYNLESCKYKVFILINHNNLHQVINIKSLNSVRFDGLKSSFNITSELIIAIRRQIEFQTLYLAFFRDLLKKKLYYKLQFWLTKVSLIGFSLLKYKVRCFFTKVGSRAL